MGMRSDFIRRVGWQEDHHVLNPSHRYPYSPQILAINEEKDISEYMTGYLIGEKRRNY